MAINLSVFAGDIDQVLLSYDVFRVERSVTVEGGPYTEITASMAAAAKLLGSNTGTFTISGLTLEVKVDNGTPVVVTFASADPVTTDQAVSEINTALGATIASNVSNAVQLTSPTTGTASKLEIVSGSAATALGFTVSQTDIGEDAYQALEAGKTIYAYTDNDGAGAYFYRVWFYNTTNAQESAKSDAFQGVPGTLVSAGALSLATVKLVNVSGAALPNQKISVYPVSKSLLVEGYGVDLNRDGQTMTTDNSGYAELNLIRGARVKVVFEGTSFIRTIDVPDAATFDLLAAVSVEDDQFDKAVVPSLSAAPRRTL